MTDNMTFNLKAPNYFQGWVFSEIHINPIIAKLLYVKKFWENDSLQYRYTTLKATSYRPQQGTTLW